MVVQVVAVALMLYYPFFGLLRLETPLTYLPSSHIFNFW
jgi:hypothetical protein